MNPLTTLAVGRFPKLVRGCLLLLLAATAVMAGCSNIKGARTPSPTFAPKALPSPVSDRVVPLPSGGSLIVPAGALPPEAEVNVELTCTPLLPELMDDVQAVGEAFAIHATEQPSRSVLLRLPVPAEAADPVRLVVIRVEPDGTTTFLMTVVKDTELVAAAPGFGTFVIGQLLYDDRVTLAGPANLVPGELATFRPLSNLPLSVQGAARPDKKHGGFVHSYLPSSIHSATWTLKGGITPVYEDTYAAQVHASAKPSWGEISYEFVDLAYGRRWYGVKSVQIASGPEAYAGQPFKVSLSTLTPVIYAGQEVKVVAALQGAFEPPITWSWDFGDGDAGGPVKTDENTGFYALPAKRYADQDLPQDHEVQVTAQDSRGREVQESIRVRVVGEPKYRVALEGPQRLAWINPGVAATYTARASGGKPPYIYGIMIAPEEDSSHGAAVLAIRLHRSSCSMSRATISSWPVRLTICKIRQTRLP
jgi:hypothetical protein